MAMLTKRRISEYRQIIAEALELADDNDAMEIITPVVAITEVLLAERDTIYEPTPRLFTPEQVTHLREAAVRCWYRGPWVDGQSSLTHKSAILGTAKSGEPGWTVWQRHSHPDDTASLERYLKLVDPDTIIALLDKLAQLAEENEALRPPGSVTF